MTDVLTALTPPKNPADRRLWVGYHLKKRGSSLGRIAASLGVARQSVYSALMTPSERIEQAIADALEMPVQALFPERFDRSGVRIPRTRPDNISALPGAGDSQKHRSLQTQTERAA